jgi:hypothetical protein
MSNIFHENYVPVIALAPDADRWTSNPATDVISMANHDEVTFIIVEGVGGTGTTTITVEECDDVTPSNSTAIAFSYRLATTGDTFAALTAVASTGYLTIGAANKMIQITIKSEQLSAGFPFVRIQTTEGDSTAVDAAIIAIMGHNRYSGDSHTSVLS